MLTGAVIEMKKRNSHTEPTNLKAIIRAYIHRIRPRAQAELEWFSHQPSVTAAIEKAALAVNSRGKRYSHQRRLKKTALKEAFRNLRDESVAIAQTADFDGLFKLVSAALEPIPGIGELYIYDTSLRIGANLNLLPTKVYLHAGTRVGARALGLDHSAATLKVSALPREFHGLEAHELEDILCIFKDELKNGAPVVPNARGIIKRSWCD
jgi:hypothetical protein